MTFGGKLCCQHDIEFPEGIQALTVCNLQLTPARGYSWVLATVSLYARDGNVVTLLLSIVRIEARKRRVRRENDQLWNESASIAETQNIWSERLRSARNACQPIDRAHECLH
jgi:hypothetical protein